MVMSASLGVYSLPRWHGSRVVCGHLPTLHSIVAGRPLYVYGPPELRGSRQVSGYLPPPVWHGMVSGRLLVGFLLCAAWHGCSQISGCLWPLMLSGRAQVAGCLLILLLTSTAISTAVGYCDDLLVTELSTAARGPSTKPVRPWVLLNDQANGSGLGLFFDV